MNALVFLLALSAFQSWARAALPEGAATGSGKPLRDDAEDARRGLGGWGGSKDTDSPTMFPTLHPTISPTLNPTLFPTVSPTFCGKAGKASGDYYYSGSKSSKSGSSRDADASDAEPEDRDARAAWRARQEDRAAALRGPGQRAKKELLKEEEAARLAALPPSRDTGLGPGTLRNSKSSKSGSGSKSGKSSNDDCTQGSRGGKSSKSSKSSSRRRLARRVELPVEEEGASAGDSERAGRAAPGARFEPDAVRRRRINRAS